MKSELVLAIVAVLIISTAASFSTTSVSAVGAPIPNINIPAVTPPTVSISETSVRDNALVLITLTVNNASGTDNVENILIIDQGAGFTRPFGGDNALDNWDNLADNLIAAGENIENEVYLMMLDAVTYLKAAGSAIEQAAIWENEVGKLLASDDNDNVKNAGRMLGATVSDGTEASAYLRKAAVLLQAEPFKINAISDNLKLAGNKENVAANWLMREGHRTDVLGSVSTGSDGVVDAMFTACSENLTMSANSLDNFLADNIENGNFGHAENNLGIMALAWDNMGNNLGHYPSTLSDSGTFLTAANYMENQVAVELFHARDNIRKAMWALENVADNLGLIENIALENCRTILAQGVRTGITSTPENFLDNAFLENLDLAALNLDLTRAYGTDNSDNLLAFGENLKNAANSLTLVKPQAMWKGPLLGSDIIGYVGETSTTSIRYYLRMAGDNLNNENLNITNAATQLKNVGTQLKAVGNKIKSTITALGGLTAWQGWCLENGGIAGTNGVLINPRIAGTTPGTPPVGITENHIQPTQTKTFKFLWMAPDISTETAYTLRIYTYTTDNTPSTPTDVTITVDGAVLYKVSMYAYQTGATENNVAGRLYDNGNVTVTVVASKALSSIGQLRIENVPSGPSPGYENIVAPISWSNPSGDSKTWTATFNVTSWVDNVENLRLRIASPWAIDNNLLENANDCQIDNFTFDVRPPMFNDNGLNRIENLLGGATAGLRRKPGSLYSYFENTKKVWDNLTADAEDNTRLYTQQVRRGQVAVTVYINDNAVSVTRLPDNKVNTGAITFADGLNVILVRATDRVGNYVENKLENIFIDNTKPVVSLVYISKIVSGVKTMVPFVDGMSTNDNQPCFQLKIQDPGYPTTGWGIPRDNVRVTLDNDITIGASLESNLSNEDNRLENLGVWDNGLCTGAYNFENLCHKDNALRAGTYYLHVRVSDNVLSTKPGPLMLTDTTRDNDNYTFTFTIKVTAPAAPPPAGIVPSVTLGASAAAAAKTKQTSITINGTGAAGDNILVYTSTDAGATWTATGDVVTINAAGNWTFSISLTQGTTTGIAVTEKDSAGNESPRTLCGFALSDASAPTVTISSPVTDTSTDQVSISVTGTIAKNTWEAYSDLAVTIQVGSATPGNVTIGTDGSFTVSAALSEGVNSITIRATDPAGNSNSQTVVVTRTVTPWATYAIIIVIIALILAAIAIFRRK